MATNIPSSNLFILMDPTGEQGQRGIQYQQLNPTEAKVGAAKAEAFPSETFFRADLGHGPIVVNKKQFQAFLERNAEFHDLQQLAPEIAIMTIWRTQLLKLPAWKLLQERTGKGPEQINIFSFIDENKKEVKSLVGTPIYSLYKMWKLLLRKTDTTLSPEERSVVFAEQLEKFLGDHPGYAADLGLQEKAIREKIVHDAVDYLQKVDAHLMEGGIPFKQTQYFISINKKLKGAEEAPAVLKSIVRALPGTKIRYDESTQTLQFGYGSYVIRALGMKSRELCKIIGEKGYTIFDDHPPQGPYEVTFAPSKVKFGLSMREFREQQQKKLLEQAKNYMSNVQLPPKTPVSLPSQCSEEHLLATCLENHSGICIGEYHSDSSPKLFLVQHFTELVAQGVATLFIEHLPSESLQDELDAFLESPKGSPMPPALSLFLDFQDHGYLLPSYGYKDVIVAAKNAGIKHIICLDTDETYRIGADSTQGVTDVNAPSRVLAMNANAAKLIEAHKDKGKYIVFAGCSHIVTTYQNTPGLSELTGCPSLFIQDESKESKAGMQQNATVCDERDTLFQYDIVLTKAETEKPGGRQRRLFYR